MTSEASSEPKGGYNGPPVQQNPRSNGHERPLKKRKMQEKPLKEGSSEEVLLIDIRNLLAAQTLEEVEPKTQDTLPEPFTEIELTVSELSSTGDGLALSPSGTQVYVVPFTAPGDRVIAKVIRHDRKDPYTTTDFVRILDPSALRDDVRVKCPYFASCSGCQFQFLDYATQLMHKKRIVEKAFKNFSGLNLQLVPTIGDTVGSPLQYGYRTKLTPHFEGPPGWKRKKNPFESVPPIGFMQKGTRKTIDIEDCPIGTDAVRKGMKSERKRVTDTIKSFKKGATLLLRESTERIPKAEADVLVQTDGVETLREVENGKMSKSFLDYVEEKTCITDPTATSVEYVDDFIFTNPAGAFFQNNNSILPIFTDYVRKNLHEPISTSSPTFPTQNINYLIDAYCGSGLFTITCAGPFIQTIGIDISSASIDFARRNARLNKLPGEKATFIAADAPALFKDVTFPATETAVVIDPPRKGCDEGFLKQLVAFGPRRVVYVSCNVHTQARDIGLLMREDESYVLESVTGFDFFPQTGHVECVAVLSKKDRNTHEAGTSGTDQKDNCAESSTREV